MSGIFPIVFGIVVIVFIGSTLLKVANGAVEWTRNNNLPITTTPAKLIAKRVDTKFHSRHHDHGTNDSFHHTTSSSSNSYFLTFEDLNSRQRMVFKVSQREFDLLVEDDIGELTHQGTRYHGFVIV